MSSGYIKFEKNFSVSPDKIIMMGAQNTFSLSMDAFWNILFNNHVLLIHQKSTEMSLLPFVLS